MLDECLRIIREKDLCVLATADEATVHCSLMAFVPQFAAPDVATLLCVTLKDTRKFANMKKNPLVSVLLDTRDECRTPPGGSSCKP